MTHQCKAGVEKLVVMYDGRIIPCEAFKGVVDVCPEFVLGNIYKGTTLEQAQDKAMQLPYLVKAKESQKASTRWCVHYQNCKKCNQAKSICEEGDILLRDALIKRAIFEEEAKPFQDRMKANNLSVADCICK